MPNTFVKSVFFVFASIWSASVSAVGEKKVADVVAMLCESSFIDEYGPEPCAKLEFNEQTIGTSEWWKPEVKEFTGFSRITGRTQFYRKNGDSDEGTVYHTIYIDGEGFTSSHKVRNANNFNSGKWVRY